jgi:hypothetical protein
MLPSDEQDMSGRGGWRGGGVLEGGGSKWVAFGFVFRLKREGNKGEICAFVTTRCITGCNGEPNSKDLLQQPRRRGGRGCRSRSPRASLGKFIRGSAGASFITRLRHNGYQGVGRKNCLSLRLGQQSVSRAPKAATHLR